MAYYKSNDAVVRSAESQYRTRIFAHGLVLHLVVKLLFIISRKSPWALSRYLKQENRFIDKNKTGSFATATAVAACAVSHEFPFVGVRRTESLQGLHGYD